VLNSAQATDNYCPHCGAQADLDAKYCKNCGKLISVSGAPFDPADQVKDFFPTYMVTLISIIQAAALGYLLLAANDQLSYIIAGTYDPIWTILIVGMFIMIVATWFQYSQLVMMLRLVPTTLGALVPFCFGVTQALVIFSIVHQQIAWFYFAMTLNALLGFSSYVVYLREAKLEEDRIENRILLERMGADPRRIEFMTVLRSTIFFSFGVAEALFKLESLFFAFVVLALNIIMIASVHRLSKKTSKGRK
jgi:hypothetical protein